MTWYSVIMCTGIIYHVCVFARTIGGVASIQPVRDEDPFDGAGGRVVSEPPGPRQVHLPLRPDVRGMK